MKWDNKKELQDLINKMRDRGMHDNPHLHEARATLAAELALRSGDQEAFKRFSRPNHTSSAADYGGGGVTE